VLDGWLCIGLILENSHYAICAVAYKHKLDQRKAAKSPRRLCVLSSFVQLACN
jgi:hypothetical protein